MPRRDDDLAELSIVPERDELRARQRPAPEHRAQEPRSVHSPGPAMAASGGGGQILASVVAVVACLWAGYLQWSSIGLQEKLAASDARIASLEARLSSTDQMVSQANDQLEDKLKEVSSEVDKLWASAWRKNKDLIDRTTADLKKLGSDIQAQVEGARKSNEKLSNVQGQIDGLSKKLAAVESLKKQLDELSKSLDATGKQLESQGQKLATVEKSTGSVNEISTQIEAVSEQLGGIENRVGEVEQDIQSINAFRKQVNARLNASQGGSQAQ